MLISRLKELAVGEYGLVDNDTRRRAWNILLLSDNSDLTSFEGEGDNENKKAKREELKRKNDYEKMKEELEKGKSDVEVTELIKEFEHMNEEKLDIASDLVANIGKCNEGAEEAKSVASNSIKDSESTVKKETKEDKFISEKAWLQTKEVIGRTMHKFDFFNSLNEETAEKYKADLRDMIYQLLTKNKYQFYQGYDEFCCVLLLILGKKQGIKAAATISKFFLRDFLRDSFEDKVRPVLFMVSDIVKAAESGLHERFTRIGVLCLQV